MIELNDEQLRRLAHAGWPPRVVNPRTHETFVLISEGLFERVRTLLEEEDEIAAVEEAYPLVSEVLETDEASSKEIA